MWRNNVVFWSLCNVADSQSKILPNYPKLPIWNVLATTQGTSARHCFKTRRFGVGNPRPWIIPDPQKRVWNATDWSNPSCHVVLIVLILRDFLNRLGRFEIILRVFFWVFLEEEAKLSCAWWHDRSSSFLQSFITGAEENPQQKQQVTNNKKTTFGLWTATFQNLKNE